MIVYKGSLRGVVTLIVGEKHFVSWDDGRSTIEIVGDDGEFIEVG